MFAKRSSTKRNFRKARALDDQESESDDDVVDSGVLEEIKLEQNLRKKQRGVLTGGLIDEKPKVEVGSKKSVDSNFGSQFSSHIDKGLSETNHEDLMEKYVEERLGHTIARQTNESPKPEDAIYRIPDSLRVAGKDPASTDPILFAGSGIAEVALPISFKIANIEATENARRKLIEQSQSDVSSSLPSYQPKSVPGDIHRHDDSVASKFIKAQFRHRR